MSMQSSRSGLRKLLRATHEAFKGDTEMLHMARQTIREQFEQNRSATPEQLPQLQIQIDEAIDFLRNNVVQAPLNERGNYTVDAKRIDESGKK